MPIRKLRPKAADRPTIPREVAILEDGRCVATYESAPHLRFFPDLASLLAAHAIGEQDLERI